MMPDIACDGGPSFAPNAGHQRLHRRILVRAAPTLVLLIALPLTGLAIKHSLGWFAAPFPGFFLMENGVVPTVSGYSWPPDRATLFHAQVIAVEGLAVRNGGEIYDYVARRPVGTAIEYTIRTDSGEKRIQIPSMPFGLPEYAQTYGILLLFGCSNLILGLIVAFLQPRTTQARVFLLHTFVAGTYAISAVFLHRSGFHWLHDYCLIAEALAPATFIHLAFVFPVERRLPGARKLLLIVPYSITVVLLAFELPGFYADPPDLTALHATYLYMAFGLLFFVGNMAFAYWQHREAAVRARIKAVLPGAMAAGLVQLLIFAENAMSGRTVPVQFGLLVPIPYYASIAYAIGRHDLFDIDRVVRQSFVYALLSLIVISSYAAIIVLAEVVLPIPRRGEITLEILFVLTLAFVLDPLRRGVQRVVDRAFYRSRVDYRATVLQVSEMLTTLLDMREILQRVARLVRETLQLESFAVCLIGAEASATLWRLAETGDLDEQPGQPGALAMARALQAGGAVEPDALAGAIDDPGERAEVERLLAQTAARLVVPLMLHGRCTGMLLLGPRRSGLAFDSEWITLFQTLANQTAIAVANAQAYAALEELNRDLDAKVREQTRELSRSNDELTRAYDGMKEAQAQLVHSEKMASLGQLVAGVAHELNNPASFVHGALGNLHEYLDRLVETIRAYEHLASDDVQLHSKFSTIRDRARLEYLVREAPELLRICTEGSERVKKIVEDLRIFVRADRGDRLPTDVHDGLLSTLRLLNDRIERGRIHLTVERGELPRVQAEEGQLNQVWMNLLANAIDAVEGRVAAEIRVTTRLVGAIDSSVHGGADGRPGPPQIEVRIADNGLGIPPEALNHVFEPFFTTKPVGRGTGLGLSIAYGAVKNHGGAITVESEPGRGSAAIVRLPGAPGR